MQEEIERGYKLQIIKNAKKLILIKKQCLHHRFYYKIIKKTKSFYTIKKKI